jgi:hypothetical protein
MNECNCVRDGQINEHKEYNYAKDGREAYYWGISDIA